EAAVDVAAAEHLDVLVAGDRVQLESVEVPAQPRAAAVLLQVLLVPAVDRDLVPVEAVDEVVRIGLDDVGAEQARRAVEVAPEEVKQAGEVAGFEQELAASREVVVALEGVLLAGEGVVPPAVAMVVEDRGAP